MVNVTFQSRDWNDKRTQPGQPDEVAISCIGFDLDHMGLSIYINDYGDGTGIAEHSGYNYQLARQTKYMNENGDECGKIGWVIDPEKGLLEKRPQLKSIVGFRYGRVIVSDGHGAEGVDQNSGIISLFEGPKKEVVSMSVKCLDGHMQTDDEILKTVSAPRDHDDLVTELGRAIVEAIPLAEKKREEDEGDQDYSIALDINVEVR